MAVPKKRMSKAKKSNRKSIWKSAAVGQSLYAYSKVCSLIQFTRKKKVKKVNTEASENLEKEKKVDAVERSKKKMLNAKQKKVKREFLQCLAKQKKKVKLESGIDIRFNIPLLREVFKSKGLGLGLGIGKGKSKIKIKGKVKGKGT